MQKKPYYITTTLPYVNSDPHIGFAMELIRADVIARAKIISGHEVFFNTGTDEHGQKIYKNAQAQSIDVQKYVDNYASKFKSLLPALDINTDAHFIRTTDAEHVLAAQQFWNVVKKNGHIYKKNYTIKYCVGCEMEKTESELVDDHCPLHPLQNIETIEEENYFFRFSQFQSRLLELYEKKTDIVIPSSRLSEIKSFVERGLEDFSISRLKNKMPWGIPVPDDDTQVMYVWFDALVNYISTIGWPRDLAKYKKWHEESGGMIQYCGKDNLRQQSAMWQAMLMAAELPPSQTIVINGFITGAGGLKMSKSLGNTVDPFEIIKQYSADALRYFVCRELSPFEDSPFSAEQFKDSYNAHLANGLGNLVSRVMKMASENLESPVTLPEVLPEWYEQCLNEYDIKKLCDHIWHIIQEADKTIQKDQPFKVIKTDAKKGKEQISDLVTKLALIGTLLRPILPATASKILACVQSNKMPEKPLFVRK